MHAEEVADPRRVQRDPVAAAERVELPARSRRLYPRGSSGELLETGDSGSERTWLPPNVEAAATGAMLCSLGLGARPRPGAAAERRERNAAADAFSSSSVRRDAVIRLRRRTRPGT